MAVIDSFIQDENSAFKEYLELHKVHKDREYYIYHTSNENLDIDVKKWMGLMQCPVHNAG